VAETFGIQNWPVTAVKAFLGHSLASAAGDQLIASLGVWRYGLIPGITTIDELAEDVSTAGLDILRQHREVDPDKLEAVIINSKGFGGNNASASLLSPGKTRQMLAHRHGLAAMTEYRRRQENTLARMLEYDTAASSGNFNATYQFGENVLDDKDIDLDTQTLKIRGQNKSVSLRVPNHYQEFCDTQD
jgi:acetoacetyl-[acyl-carrier protein] synthase